MSVFAYISMLVFFLYDKSVFSQSNPGRFSTKTSPKLFILLRLHGVHPDQVTYFS